MRIAILSDIHGNLAALEAVLADVDRRGCDVVVNLGDIVSGPLQPAETAERLMALDLPTIRGNHERQLLEIPPDRMGLSDRHAYDCLHPGQMEWIAGLRATRWLGDEVFLCHGTPDSDLAYFLETLDGDRVRPASLAEADARAAGVRATLILCGHTHLQRVRALGGGRLVVNPGSVGLPAFDTDQPHRHVVESGSPHARYAVATRARGAWSVESLALAYDWESPARQAERLGRDDWARALRTGHVA